MCRLFTLTSKDPLSPMEAIKALDVGCMINNPYTGGGNFLPQNL